MEGTTRTILMEELEKVTAKLGPGYSNALCVSAVSDV
jgi:hypothetical protein